MATEKTVWEMDTNDLMLQADSMHNLQTRYNMYCFKPLHNAAIEAEYLGDKKLLKLIETAQEACLGKVIELSNLKKCYEAEINRRMKDGKHSWLQDK